MKPIVVVGSINWDISIAVPHLPVPGETVAGGDAVSGLGGKGANQAIAAARAGGKVRLVGSVGQDSYGAMARSQLEAEGIELDLLLSTRPTGMALIGVDKEAQNSILLSAGANSMVKPEHIHPHLFEDGAHILLQLELPLQTVRATIECAKQKSATVVLNASPIAKGVQVAHLMGADVLLVNEIEAGQLLGQPPANTQGSALEYAAALNTYFGLVVVTLGANGVVWSSHSNKGFLPSFKVTAVDSTGAGDAFAGALTVALTEGTSIPGAVALASAAGALATLERGASTSPQRVAINQLIELQPSEIE